MYTKEDISRQKQAFWTTFGRYMQPVLSAEGTAVSWVNYKTGIPGIQFKMDADHKHTRIAITCSHKDASLRVLQYQRLTQMKAMLEEELQGEMWDWQENLTDEWGKTIDAVSKTLANVSIHRKEDWPAMISFLKQRIIALDAFWSMARYGFEEFL
ncbi:DUF4268 domain-containing protein [Filimonas effusa]|uniref:DUF4268 domain-containing protein n=1 Tax=Filimonas effusa TaxID=2508721 RepID=A0A4Q1DBU5_9BACT|nr:DUF4268 domain-containing protein [Filimonas effusa]RXK86917.1 DUF4268 domain-containing protein [Filimonas effusa]